MHNLLPNQAGNYLAGMLFAWLLCVACWSNVAYANTDVQYWPSEIELNAHIATPTSVIGAPVGEWHVRHDQLLQYFNRLAEQSPRMKIKEIGRTHENRSMIHLYVSSPDNLARLESIRQQHMQAWLNPGSEAPDNLPIVVQMGYSIHGDEPSGANASLLLAWYLAAAQGEEINALLDNLVIIIEPSQNPDGLARFAQWANMHKGKHLVSDPAHREHVQGWPRGRTNHYWFDLNRDWLPLTHPESQARIKQFHQWRPHVLTDFHEMGTNSTYFFQPGVPSRVNPLTSADNIRLTKAFGEFFSQAFDGKKQMYFSEELFDDFYYGKGSSYPDANGSIGILFEQGSARGHVQESINGNVTFIQTIKNQFLTSLTTLRGALALQSDLLEMQHSFKRQTLSLARNDESAGYVVTEQQDPTRLRKLLTLLDAHQIEVYPIDKTIEADGIQFVPGSSYFIPSEQIQYRLVKSLFSNRKRFPDNTFYDVSNWNLAHAYNIQYRAIEKSRWRRVSYNADTVIDPPLTISNKLNSQAVAHIFGWQDSHSPVLLQHLLNAGVQARISSAEFNVTTDSGAIVFGAGSVVVPNNQQQPNDHLALLASQADQLGMRVWSAMSGATSSGPDLGSRAMLPAVSPQILLVGGSSISSYQVGELWHFFDQQLQLAPTIVDWQQLSRIPLARYTHIFVVDGNYNTWSKAMTKRLGQWLEQGGILVGQQGATQWLAQQDWLEATFVEPGKSENLFDTSQLTYGDKDQLAAKKRVAGAVYQANIDTSHPLMFGFQQQPLALFKTQNLVMRKPIKPFVTVAQYTTTPLLAGYSSNEMEEQIANSAAIIAHSYGEGVVIALMDRSNFRGYWQGTNKILSNILYMSYFIDASG